MNFLIKIEEALNRLIIRLLEKLKAIAPQYIFDIYAFVGHLPQLFQKKYKFYQPKLRIMGLKLVGYTEHYTTMLRGNLTAIMIYMRSEEFKKADKFTLLMMPVKYVRANPLKTFYGICALVLLSGAGTVIFKNAEKIVAGTYALRKPASFEVAEADVFVEFKKQKYIVTIGGVGAVASSPELPIYLDIKIEAQNTDEKEYLDKMEEHLRHLIEALNPQVEHLPLTAQNKKKIEETILLMLNTELKKPGHERPIKAISIKQVLPGRPVYYRQTERILAVTDMNLQIFLEDTRRNKQVWIDFSILASNRNAVLYLKEHEVEFKDHLTTNVEPVIPQLPVEEEGRLIIKDKIKLELNQFLEKNGIEGKIQEVYIDYLISS